MIRTVERDTIGVYEANAAAWRAQRPPTLVDDARAFATDVGDRVRVDLGCGPGTYLPHLGRPVVALDAAYAMLELAREEHPDAWAVQGDLEALPFRRGSLGGSWARASYLHVRRERLPWALLQLHRALTLGAPAAFTFLQGANEGPLPGDFPGRFFAQWEPEPLRDVLVGAGFEVERVATSSNREWISVRVTRARTHPDFVGPGMRVLVCGLNPSVYAADQGVGFARPGNRFWPAALASGLASRDRDPGHALREHGIGMTDLVKRATPNANMLTKDEYRDGAARVQRLVEWLRPRVVCFVGLTGWRTAVDPKAVAGLQPSPFGGRPAYVMPNTSGVNAHVQLPDVVAHLRAAMAVADCW
jgi:TDG/mug DNA glycosylase family protein